MLQHNKKAALELSVGTIVIIVLAMAMLIMGIVLVKNIFSGATGATDLINQNVKSQINKLFNDEDTKTVVYLADNSAQVQKGESYNIRFGIKNVIRGGTGATQDFSYKVSAAEVESGCSLTLTEADGYIALGKTVSKIPISPGEEPKERVILIEIPEDAPLCGVTYDIVVYKGEQGGEVYDTNFFNLRIEG